jgi:dTDP-4-dehydrorhamnose 3,5-epimerase-like enzyme
MVEIINGDSAKDDRGQLQFVNDFDMSAVKRFYKIKNADLNLIRGWRAHQIEQRWFHAIAGIFRIQIVKIDNWIRPSENLSVETVILNATKPQILYIPKGYATAMQALENDSELMVFADYGVDHAINDDFVYPIAYFINRK